MSAFEAVETIENGTGTEAETLQAWAVLIATGLAWTLQGFYGRTAMQLIKSGLISVTGEILS